jgi:hypothetical protein
LGDKPGNAAFIFDDQEAHGYSSDPSVHQTGLALGLF